MLRGIAVRVRLSGQGRARAALLLLMRGFVDVKGIGIVRNHAVAGSAVTETYRPLIS